MELILLLALIAVVLAFGVGYWSRGRAAATVDDKTAEAEPAADWPDPLPAALRLEAAAPEEVAVSAPFDVIAALLPPGESPTLPQALAAATPAAPVNGSPGLDFYLRIDAPGFACHGPATRAARYTGPDRPPIAVFSLSAEQVGEGVIRLIALQGLAEIARVRLRVRAAASAPATTDNLGTRAALTARPPQAAAHLLAHAIAASYTPTEFQALAESLDADPADLVGGTPFTQALDLVQAVSRRGDGPALAQRVATERPNWRVALRGNPRAEKLL